MKAERMEMLHRIEWYLMVTGGAELAHICRDCQVTEVQARSALAELGAETWHSVNPWPKLKRTIRTGDGPFMSLTSAQKLTVHKLPKAA